MKLHYDPDGDILVIYLKDSQIIDSDEDERFPGIIFDQDSQGDLVSIEILSASKRVSDLGKIMFDFPLQRQMARA